MHTYIVNENEMKLNLETRVRVNIKLKWSVHCVICVIFEVGVKLESFNIRFIHTHWK